MLADISHPDELHFPMINSPHLFILIFLSITQFLLRMPGAWLIANNTVWTNEWVNNSSFNLFLNAKLFSVYCICLGNQHLSASQCVFLPSFSSFPFPCLHTYSWTIRIFSVQDPAQRHLTIKALSSSLYHSPFLDYLSCWIVNSFILEYFALCFGTIASRTVPCI